MAKLLTLIFIVNANILLINSVLSDSSHITDIYKLMNTFCPAERLCQKTTELPVDLVFPDGGFSRVVPSFPVPVQPNNSKGNDSWNNGEGQASDKPACCFQCSCDDQVCDHRGNCCPGIHRRPAENGSSAQQAGCLPLSMHVYKISEGTDRHATNSSTTQTLFGIYMVTSCSNGTEDRRCTDPNITSLQETVPYTCAITGVTYRNLYCAQCNNAMDTFAWKVHMSCSNQKFTEARLAFVKDVIEELYKNVVQRTHATCGIEFYPPDDITVASDLCYLNGSLVDNCQDGNASQTLKDACKTYHDPIVIQNRDGHGYTAFANVFCGLCAYKGDNNTCPKPTSGNKVHSIDRMDNPFVAELNTGYVQGSVFPKWTPPELKKTDPLGEGKSCGNTSFYDPFTKTCGNWYCPSGRYFHDSGCVPLYTDIEKAKFRIDLTLTLALQPEDNIELGNKTLVAQTILQKMFDDVKNIKTDIIISAYGQNEEEIRIFVVVVVSVDRSSDNVHAIFDQGTYYREFEIGSQEGVFTFKAELSVGVKVSTGRFPVSTIAVVDMRDFNTMPLLYSDSIDEVEAALQLPSVTKLSFCRKLRPGKHIIRDYNDIVDVYLANIRLVHGEFERTTKRGELEICLFDYIETYSASLSVRAERLYTPQILLSVVCSMLSITGLILTILTYILFDELRSIPGKNNMMLAFHLLVAQCLYQFGMGQTDNQAGCVVIGAFIHMFWLTAIFWMNACTLHMFRTFVTGQSYRSVRALDPQVCCYGFYCYGVSICLVMVNIATSLYRSDGEDIGYGGNICYISRPVMVGWVFALPVGVVIILNLGFFFAVVYQISASTMRRRGKASDRANTLIYMKLSSLTGVTWIFGFLYIWTNFEPFEYLFIVLNAGQGVLIFISFICTHRIMKMYFNSFRRMYRWIRKHICACNCDRNSSLHETTSIEVNTGKISLTAGSSSKGFKHLSLRSLRSSVPRQNKPALGRSLSNESEQMHTIKETAMQKSQSLKIPKVELSHCIWTNDIHMDCPYEEGENQEHEEYAADNDQGKQDISDNSVKVEVVVDE